MDKLKKNLIFYVLLSIDFYVIPWFIKDTGSGMFMMLLIIPVIWFVTSIGYGMKNGFCFWYALIAAIMFIPSVFVFYNVTAWIYIIAYGGIALLGNLAALLLRRG